MEAKEKVAARVRKFRQKKKSPVVLPGKGRDWESRFLALEQRVTVLESSQSLQPKTSDAKSDAGSFSRVMAEKEKRLRSV